MVGEEGLPRGAASARGLDSLRRHPGLREVVLVVSPYPLVATLVVSEGPGWAGLGWAGSGRLAGAGRAGGRETS